MDLPFDAEGLTERIVRQLKVLGEDWLDSCRRLSAFEEKYLMDDPLNGDALAQHARALSTLEWIGGLITRSTEDPRFPDRRFADLIAAMIQDLQDRRAMWHSKMPTEQREQIVREIFNLR